MAAKGTVVIDAQGAAHRGSVDGHATAWVEATVHATSTTPTTALQMFAEPFSPDQPDSELFAQSLPGVFGAHLLRAPVHFGWDSASTITVAGLDALLSVYAAQCAQFARKGAHSGASQCSPCLAEDDERSTAEEEEDELEEEEEEEEDGDELSGDENDDIDDTFASDDGEEEDCDSDEPLCAE